MSTSAIQVVDASVTFTGTTASIGTLSTRGNEGITGTIGHGTSGLSNFIILINEFFKIHKRKLIRTISVNNENLKI